jgi:hypothetical protein
MQVVSHIDGSNARASLWPDRVEWTKESGGGRKPASDTVLLGFLTHVTTHKDGLRFYAVNILVQPESRAPRPARVRSSEV